MERNSIIKMTKKLNVTDLAGEKVMIDFESGKYFLVKGAGNDIWDMLQEETEVTPGQIIDKLMGEYEVALEECEKSVFDFLEKMEAYHFIEQG